MTAPIFKTKAEALDGLHQPWDSYTKQVIIATIMVVDPDGTWYNSWDKGRIINALTKAIDKAKEEREKAKEVVRHKSWRSKVGEALEFEPGGYRAAMGNLISPGDSTANELHWNVMQRMSQHTGELLEAWDQIEDMRQMAGKIQALRIRRQCDVPEVAHITDQDMRMIQSQFIDAIAHQPIRYPFKIDLRTFKKMAKEMGYTKADE